MSIGRGLGAGSAIASGAGAGGGAGVPTAGSGGGAGSPATTPWFDATKVALAASNLSCEICRLRLATSRSRSAFDCQWVGRKTGGVGWQQVVHRAEIASLKLKITNQNEQLSDRPVPDAVPALGAGPPGSSAPGQRQRGRGGRPPLVSARWGVEGYQKQNKIK